MPNRYEREIEEILRNLEHTEPKPGIGQKFGDRLRRKPSVRVRQRRVFSFNFSTTEWLLIATITLALVAGGYAYYMQRGDLFSGILAIIGFVCFVLVAISGFVGRRLSRPQSFRYGNVTVTPLRRNPLSTFRTRWNLFLLKMRYRRKNGR